LGDVGRTRFSSAAVVLFQRPVASFLLRNPALILLFLGILLIHGAFTFFQLPSWRCPVHDLFGIPCPGCGMTRGMLCLISGDWHGAVQHHLFAPFFLFGGLMLLAMSILPREYRIQLAERLEQIERKTGITMIFMWSFAIFGIVRMLVHISVNSGLYPD